MLTDLRVVRHILVLSLLIGMTIGLVHIPRSLDSRQDPLIRRQLKSIRRAGCKEIHTERELGGGGEGGRGRGREREREGERVG